MRHIPEHHPCFNLHMRERYGRIHVPVAPECNVQCRFCNRRYDCVNESRPGVTSAVLRPDQAVAYLKAVVAARQDLAVVGIAGPGDPFATPDRTLETFRRIREEFPDMLLCVASNGLAVSPYIDDLVSVGISHITITVNAVDPEIGKNVYRWVRDGTRVLRGSAGAERMIQKQLEAIRCCRERGVIVKVNSILLPGINDDHIECVAKTVAEAGADLFNCIPLLPAAGSELEHAEEPDPELVRRIRIGAKQYLPQMEHCTRCRADAAGLLGERHQDTTTELIRSCSVMEIRERGMRAPRVAVATYEGMLVNQHLGNALTLHIYEPGEAGPRFVEERTTPLPGGGDQRWHELTVILHDCHMVLANAAGQRPVEILARNGIEVVVMEGLVNEALREVFAGRPIPLFMTTTAPRRCSSGCSGGGEGCAA